MFQGITLDGDSMISFLLLLNFAAFADCSLLLKEAEQNFDSRYQVPQLRQIVYKIHSAQTAAETQIFLDLSAKFKTFDSSKESDLNEMFALQKQARHLVRTNTARAGYQILNPEEPSPYDAVILEKDSSDGYAEYLLEIRSLLINADPLPHLTLWTQRNDSAHNPWHVVTVGVAKDPRYDYVSWYNQNTKRVSASKIDFLKSLLPKECRLP